MLSNQRRDKILDLLKEDGSAKVIDSPAFLRSEEVTESGKIWKSSIRKALWFANTEASTSRPSKIRFGTLL